MEEVYNRGFSSGFYFGKPSSEDYADVHGSKATTKKEYIGKVLNYYKRSKIAYIKLETGKLKPGDKIMISGSTSGVVYLKLDKILLEEITVDKAIKGDKITFCCDEIVRHNDSVYIISVCKFNRLKTNKINCSKVYQPILSSINLIRLSAIAFCSFTFGCPPVFLYLKKRV